VRARFAGVQADKSVRRRMISAEKFGDRATECEKGGVVEGRSPGDAADAVGAKKLSGHRVRGSQGLTNEKFSTATAESRGGQKRMC
jgi:hypothetical protein